MKSMEECADDSPPTTWKLLGCENGLRFFQEVPSSQDSKSLFAKQRTVVKCLGVVDTSAERACTLILDYGPLRSLWDSTVENAHVLESKDGKTDVLQLTLRSARTSWWSRPKHLVLLRWWTRHQDGSYVIFFKTMSTSNLKQERCSPALPSSWLDCGAYIIRPLNTPISAPTSPATQPLSPCMRPSSGPDSGAMAGPSPRCVVELALETEEGRCQACSWMQCCCSTSSLQLEPAPTNSNHRDCILWPCSTASNDTFLRNAMFHSIAGLREFCAATAGGAAVTVPPHMASHRSHTFHLPQMTRVGRGKLSPSLAAGAGDALRQPLLLRKAESESHDESFEDCTMESLSDMASELSEPGLVGAGALSAARQHPTLDRVLSVHEHAYPVNVDWEAFPGSVRRGHPDQEDCRNSWMPPHGTEFLVRGHDFYSEGAKAAAGPPLCQVVAVDWFHAREPMHGVSRESQSVVQRVRAHHKERAPFFLVLNLQIPAGSKGHYSLVFYFATSDEAPCLRPGTLLHKFITTEEDEFRDRRLALIPAIPVGSWLIRNAVGSERFVMLAEVLSTRYVRGEGFFEMDVNMGTSSVVSGILGLVIPCMSVLTVDMAFFVKAEEGDPLPEELFGAVRCCNLEQGSAVPLN